MVQNKIYSRVLKMSVFLFFAVMAVTFICKPNHVQAALIAPDCTTFGVYFDRCANESYYAKLSSDDGIANAGAWIWPAGNAQIDRAHSSVAAGDRRGFIDVVKADLNVFDGGFIEAAYKYLDTGVCDTPAPKPDTNLYCKKSAGILLGSSYFVNTMMGYGGNNPAFGKMLPVNFPNQTNAFLNVANKRMLRGVDNARKIFKQWAKIVEYYDSQGWVDWNFTTTDFDCFRNCKDNDPLNDLVKPGNERLDQVVHIGRNPVDVLSYINPAASHDPYIKFYNPDGTYYLINKHCGNVTGIPSAFELNNKFNVNHTAITELDDAENPTKATFKLSASISGFVPVKGVVFKRFYYIHKYGTPPGDKINLIVSPLNSSSQNDTHDFLNKLNFIFPQQMASGADIENLKAGDEVCMDISIEPPSGEADPSGNITERDPNYTAPICDTVIDKPYLKFFGGDVYTGGGFNDGGASCDVLGGIRTFNYSASNRGSSAQFAATALGDLKEFTTANLGTTGNFASPPNGLTFANTPSDGGFDKEQCINNYWKDAAAVPLSSGNTVDIDTITSGVHKYGSNVVINPGSIGKGKKVVLYVDGSARIKGNINYDTDFTGGSLANENEIPTFILIAKDNIYIDPDVIELNGIYIAQGYGDTTNNLGTIYTCADPSGGGFKAYPKPISESTSKPFQEDGLCHQERLTVYGTFVARTVKFLRTKGSLRNSKFNEKYNESTSRAAETFVMSPEMYVVVDGLCGSVPIVCNKGGYDAITGLPPVL